MGSGTGRPWGEDTLVIRPATALDAHNLAPNLVQADKDEIYAMCGLDPVEGFLWAHAEAEESWVAVLEDSGDVIGMWGASPFDDAPAASVWLMCSPRVKERPLTFQKTVKACLADLSSRYGPLCGYCDVRNTDHLRWVKRLGFKVLRVIKLGPQGHEFHEFVGGF